MSTTNFTCRMDSKVKAESEALYNELGMNLTTAINVFLKESLRVGGFPFDVRLNHPNRATLLALREAERISDDPDIKGYDVEDALAELKK